MIQPSPLSPNPSDKTFLITRHAHSCNNLKEGKAGALSVYDRTSEHDPGITIYGMLACLKKTSVVTDDRYISNTVFVSCLIRTWMTAILLYLPNVTGGNLDMIISPYLKEKHTLLSFKSLGEGAKRFLNPVASALLKKHRLYNASNHIVGLAANGIATIDGGNLPKDIGEQLIMLIHFFNNLSVISEYLNSISDTKLLPTIEKIKGKTITLKLGKEGIAEEAGIKLTIGDDLKINIEELKKEAELTSTISKYYYFKTLMDPGFPRNPETKTIIEILGNYLLKTGLILDIDNIKNYVGKILPELENEENQIGKPIVDDSDAVTEPDEEYNDDEDDNIVDISDEEKKELVSAAPGFKGGSTNNLTPLPEGLTVNDFLTKHIDSFITWVTVSFPKITKIHAVTHSDCMQSFCSKFIFTDGLNLVQEINIKTQNFKKSKMPELKAEMDKLKEDLNKSRQNAKLEYGEFGNVMFATLSDINTKMSSDEKGYKKYNKKNFELKTQNSWDLQFTYPMNGNAVKDIHAFYGVFQPSSLDNFISACERNCHYGFGAGNLVTQERKNTCTSRISGTSRLGTKAMNIFRNPKSLVTGPATVAASFGRSAFGNTIGRFFNKSGGKRTRKNKKQSKTHRKRKNNKRKSRK